MESFTDIFKFKFEGENEINNFLFNNQTDIIPLNIDLKIQFCQFPKKSYMTYRESITFNIKRRSNN